MQVTALRNLGTYLAVAAKPSAAPAEPVDMVDLGTAAAMVLDTELHKPDTVWRFAADGWMYEPTVGPDRTVYVGCGNDHLYAFNPDGSVRWKAPAGLVLCAPAQAADGTVYASNHAGQLIAFTPDGNELWRFDLGWSGGTPAVAEDGMIYVGSGRNRVLAIRPDGTKKWEAETRGGVTARPVRTPDGRVVVGDLFGTLFSFDAETGKEQWRRDTHEPFRGPVAVGADDSILMTRWKSLESLDPRTGKTRWAKPMEPARDAGPVVTPGGTILVASWNGSMSAFDARGDDKWTRQVDGTLATTPVLGADGTIVVRAMDRRVWAFTPHGSVAWSQEIPNGTMGASILSAPTVGPDGTVYVGNNDSSLTALHFRSLERRMEDAREAGKPEAPRIEVGEEWIIIGGVKVPVNRA